MRLPGVASDGHSVSLARDPPPSAAPRGGRPAVFQTGGYAGFFLRLVFFPAYSDSSAAGPSNENTVSPIRTDGSERILRDVLGLFSSGSSPVSRVGVGRRMVLRRTGSHLGSASRVSTVSHIRGEPGF